MILVIFESCVTDLIFAQFYTHWCISSRWNGTRTVWNAINISHIYVWKCRHNETRIYKRGWNSLEYKLELHTLGDCELCGILWNQIWHETTLEDIALKSNKGELERLQITTSRQYGLSPGNPHFVILNGASKRKDTPPLCCQYFQIFQTFSNTKSAERRFELVSVWITSVWTKGPKLITKGVLL